MISAAPSCIHLSLVSHTNVGKTTLARTLLGRDVGEVRDALLGRLALTVFAIGVVDAQHHQTRVGIVGHVGARPRQEVDAAEVARLAQVGAQPLVQLAGHGVGVALVLLGAIFGQLGDRRLGGVPVASGVLIEIGGRSTQAAQRVAEDGRRLAGHDAAELDAPVFQAAVGGRGRGGRAEVDRAGHASSGLELAQVRHFTVDAQRQRVGAINILLDDRHPVV